MNVIADLLTPKDILLDVDVAGKDLLFGKIGEHMQWVHGIPQKSVEQSLAHREQIGTTALGRGIAIPHARIKELERIRLAYLRLREPIAFDAPDSRPVTDVLVILVPKLANEEHLQILAQSSQMFSSARFRDQLHRCRHPMEVKQLFDSWPQSLF